MGAEQYTDVFGGLKVKTSTLKTIYAPKKPPMVPEHTLPACEAAMSALGSATSALEAAIAVPNKLFGLAQRVLDYPAGMANELIGAAQKALSGALNEIDDLLSLPGGISRALEAVLDCPILADSSVGKQAAGLLDDLNNGLDITSGVRSMAKDFSKAAKDAVKDAMATPTGQLANMKKMYNEAIKNSGIKDVVSGIKDLRACVDAACTAADILAGAPRSVDEILDDVGAAIDTATGEISGEFYKAASAAQDTGLKALKALEEVSEVVKFE